MATAAGGPHPTGMHSYWLITLQRDATNMPLITAQFGFSPAPIPERIQDLTEPGEHDNQHEVIFFEIQY